MARKAKHNLELMDIVQKTIYIFNQNIKVKIP